VLELDPHADHGAGLFSFGDPDAEGFLILVSEGKLGSEGLPQSIGAVGERVAPVRTEAIVLRTFDWSETSLIAWVYTRQRGRLHLLAKGARRPRSAFEGALEPLVRGELVSYQRKGKAGDGLEIAKEFDPLDRHTGLRRDLARLYRGLYVGELLLQLSERELVSEERWAPCARP